MLQRAKEMYNQAMGANWKFDEDFTYDIDIDNIKDQETLYCTSVAKFPYIKQLVIYNSRSSINSRLQKLFK